MGHHVLAIISSRDNLVGMLGDSNLSKVVPLDQGFYLLPLTDQLYNEIPAASDDGEASDNGFERLSPKVLRVIVEHSDNPGAVYFETNYFGGSGNQGAVAVKNRQIVLGPEWRTNAINDCLKLIGVTAAGHKDCFEALGIGRFRSNEDWLLQPEYLPRRQGGMVARWWNLWK